MDLKKLARRLGLSPTTVSRVLGGNATQHRIAPKTQARVLKAARASGVVVNLTGRSLRLGRSQVIGLIVPDVSNPFFAELARHAERAARIRGHSVLLADSQESEEGEAESFALMRARGVDGLLVAPVSGRGPGAGLFAKWGKPLVVVDRAPPGLHPVSVVLDNFGAARSGVSLLAAAGHRAIACIHGEPGSYSDRERLRGYRAAMKKLGLCQRKDWIAGGSYSIEAGKKGLRALLTCPMRPTAILPLGNLLALGALEALREAELGVPADVSLISFDEQPWAAFLSPPLTTISQPVQQMSEMAVDLLFELFENTSSRTTPRRVVLPFCIIERASICCKTTRRRPSGA